MTQRTGIRLFFLGTILSLLGCGKSAPNKADGEISQSTARSFASGGSSDQILALTRGDTAKNATTFGSAGSSVSTREFGAGLSQLRELGLLAESGVGRGSSDCKPTYSGQNPDTDDADGDKIVDTTAKFDCTYTTRLGRDSSSIKVAGEVTTKDGDATKKEPLGGARIDIKSLTLTLTSSSRASTSLDFAMNGFAEVKNPEAKKFEGTAEMNASISYGGQKGEVWWVLDLLNVTADDESSPKTSGKAKFHGFYSIDFNSQKYTLEMTTEDKELPYRSSCSKHYESGNVIFIDGKGNKIKITFACSSATFYYNDQLITGTDAR